LACLGFEVRSRLRFRLLRPAEGRPLEIVDHEGVEPDVGPEPLMWWNASATNPFARRIYTCDDGYAVWHEAIGWFIVDPSRPSIAIPPTEDDLSREEQTWGLPAALCVAEGGGLALHAAAVDVGGSAILISAPGGHGKTTMAAAFLRAGHRVLADDMSSCRINPEPSVLPGPAIIRIRRDVYGRLELPETHLVAEDDQKFHLMLSASAAGSGDPVPVAAVVFLRDASLRAVEDRPRIQAVATERSLPNLWTVNFTLPTRSARQRAFQKTAAFAAHVPMWDMYRPAGFDDLSGAVDLVVRTCLRRG
jgi:hypothetical protein